MSLVSDEGQEKEGVRPVAVAQGVLLAEKAAIMDNF